MSWLRAVLTVVLSGCHEAWATFLLGRHRADQLLAMGLQLAQVRSGFDIIAHQGSVLRFRQHAAQRKKSQRLGGLCAAISSQPSADSQSSFPRDIAASINNSKTQRFSSEFRCEGPPALLPTYRWSAQWRRKIRRLRQVVTRSRTR